jgi:CHAD domain-containing protein
MCEGCLGDDWAGYDHFHDARKSVKRLHYQLAILEDIGFFAKKRIGPNKLGHERQTLGQLGELLGDHHDLTILGSIDLAEKAKIESALLDLGHKAFARKPKKHRTWMATQIC